MHTSISNAPLKHLWTILYTMNYYFDYAASTPVSNAVLEAMTPWMQDCFANPSSAHTEGVRAANAIKAVRERIAEKIGALPTEIIFTSGASEANNLAIKGVAFKYLNKKSHVITSSIEHKCILNTCAYLESIGFEVSYLEPDQNGIISPELLMSTIRKETILISIHHVNNELGTIQPIADYGEIAFKYGIPFHTDAAQSFCKLSIDVDESDIDMLSLSGHKIFGPKGIGALYVRNARDSELVPLIHGANQELGLRGGTLPTPLIIGLGAAVESFPIIPSPQQYIFEKTIERYSYIRNGGQDVVPTIWNVTFSNDTEANKFNSDQKWLVSQGSACNAIANVASHVLVALGIRDEEARRTYRVSLPPYDIATLSRYSEIIDCL